MGHHMEAQLMRVATTQEGTNLPCVGPPGHRAKLVVLAGEVAGRWSEETIIKARARVEPIILKKKRAEQIWRMRCGALCSRVPQHARSRHRCWRS